MTKTGNKLFITKILLALLTVIGISCLIFFTSGAAEATSQSNVYDVANGTLTINESNLSTYNGFTVTGSGDSYSNKLIVDGVNAVIVIDGLNITEADARSSTHSAIELKNGATLSLVVVGTNNLQGTYGGAGIEVPAGCKLIIMQSSTGVLNAKGANRFGGGAGIGATAYFNILNPESDPIREQTVGEIVIQGGTVNATGGTTVYSGTTSAVCGGAGIGGTVSGQTGKILISGGTVTATGGYASAGIGGSLYGKVESIEITGGVVNANGYQSAYKDSAAAIGTGNAMDQITYGADIKLTGGHIVAIGNIGYGGAPQTTGSYSGGNVTVTKDVEILINNGTIEPAGNSQAFDMNVDVYDSRLSGTETVSVTVYHNDLVLKERQLSLKVSDYHGNARTVIYLPSTFNGENVRVKVAETKSGGLEWSEDATLTSDMDVTVGDELAELELLIQSSGIVGDIELPKEAISVVGTNSSLTSTNHVIEYRIVKVAEGRGAIRMFLPTNDIYTISVTSPSLNGGKAMINSEIGIESGKNSYYLFNESDQNLKEFNINNGSIVFGYTEGGTGYYVEYYTDSGALAIVTGLSTDDEITVFGTGATSNTVTVNGWGTTPLKLIIRNINISNVNAIDINGSYVSLKLAESNTVSGGASDANSPALISVDSSSQLTISGEGSLNVEMARGAVGAGIGGDGQTTAGTVIFDGGTFNVNIGDKALGAGIGGGGYSNANATVVINGGTYNISSRGLGAGIGAGDARSKVTPRATVTINGGIFYLCKVGSASNQGISIGAGTYGHANVTINGGSFFSNRGQYYNGYIGLASNSDGQLTLKINGGSISCDVSNVAYTNSAGSALTKVTVTLDRAKTLIDINNSAVSGIDYGFKDVMTDASSKVYLYLPESVTTLTVDSFKYTGSVSAGFVRQFSLRVTDPIDSAITASGASVSVQSTGGATVYWMSSASQPTTAQLKNQSSMTVGTSGDITVPLTGLNFNSSYTFWFVAEKDGAFTEIKKVSFKTLKLTPTLDVLNYSIPDGLTYDGRTHAVGVNSGVMGLGTISVLYRLEGDKDFTSEPPKNAGIYEVIAEIAEGSSYFAETLELGTLEISKNSLSDVEVIGYVGEYDRNEHDSVTVIGALDDLFIEYSTDGGLSWTVTPVKVRDLTSQRITVRLSGDNYEEKTVTVDVQVVSATLKADMVSQIEKVYYDGTEKQHRIKLVAGGVELILDEDYKVSYSSTVNAGAGVATFSGIGRYCGTLEVEFTVFAKPVTSLSFEGLDEGFIYTGSEIRPEFRVSDGGVLLTEGSDYTVEYSNNVECGVATATVVLTGNYSGRVEHSFRIEHKFNENGFCVCDAYQPATLSVDGYYEIGNAGNLFWFASYINTTDRTASARLVADVDLENRPWTPIGTTGEDSNNFRGVFDGQNHTIKGLYVVGSDNGVGFFGEVRCGTVKNFTIYGEVEVSTEVDYVGGVIGSICGLNSTDHGLLHNGAVVQNITSYVNLTAKAHGVGKIGGFVGYANHESLIENCSWYGTFDAGIYRVDNGAGGFIGRIQENSGKVTIRNCAAYGTIRTGYVKGSYVANGVASDTIYIGGFLSYSNTGAETVLENCLFAGKFERGENLTDKAELAAFGTLNSVKSITNCYYLGDGSLAAVHSGSPLNPESDNVEITSVTVAQLLSGEVAYMLGEAFGQTFGGEDRQSYPVLGGETTPSSRFEIYGQQLNIGGDLSMKYYVMGYAPELDPGSLTMTFILNGVSRVVYATSPDADGFYVFTLEGVGPQCMGDNIYAKLYYGEIEVASHGYDEKYSVEKNLTNLLEDYKDDAALVTLIKDTLAYGEAASVYRNHQTMTGNTYTENSSNREIPVSEADRFEIEPNYHFVEQYTVRFGTTLSIKIKVSYLSEVKMYVNGKEYVTTEEDVNRGWIIFESDPISATDFDKDFSVIIQNDEGENYSYIHVSVNDCLYAISQSTDASDTMKALAKALYNYGVSAEEYAALQNN